MYDIMPKRRQKSQCRLLIRSIKLGSQQDTFFKEEPITRTLAWVKVQLVAIVCFVDLYMCTINCVPSAYNINKGIH